MRRQNNRIRAVIADDEPLARRRIRQLLESHKDIDIVAEAGNGSETVRALRELKPDLVFLDIQMSALDGLAVLEAIGAKQMPVAIIVTAHEECAVRTCDADAPDYLSKPLKQAKFAAALERVRRQRCSASAFELSRKLSALAEPGTERRKQRIMVRTSTGNVVISADEINWIQAENYYAAIYARQQRLLVRESLASLVQRLDPSCFIRVHRSAIVNLDRVLEVRDIDGQTLLLLNDGTQVPVSRRRRNAMRQILGGVEPAVIEALESPPCPENRVPLLDTAFVIVLARTDN